MRGLPGGLARMFDDKGRVVAAMTFDSDLGDSREFADDPSYDKKYSA